MFIRGGGAIVFMIVALYLMLVAAVAFWLFAMCVIWATQLLCVPALVMVAMGMGPKRIPNNLFCLLLYVGARRVIRVIAPEWWRQMSRNQLGQNGPVL